jgi:hypothetical protein
MRPRSQYRLKHRTSAGVFVDIRRLQESVMTKLQRQRLPGATSFLGLNDTPLRYALKLNVCAFKEWNAMP